jgi:hypothetical protein
MATQLDAVQRPTVCRQQGSAQGLRKPPVEAHLFIGCMYIDATASQALQSVAVMPAAAAAAATKTTTAVGTRVEETVHLQSVAYICTVVVLK